MKEYTSARSSGRLAFAVPAAMCAGVLFTVVNLANFGLAQYYSSRGYDRPQTEAAILMSSWDIPETAFFTVGVYGRLACYRLRR